MALPRTWDVEPSGRFWESLGRLLEKHPREDLKAALRAAILQAPMKLQDTDFDDPPSGLTRRGDSNFFDLALPSGFKLVLRRDLLTYRHKPVREEVWFCAIEHSS